MEPAHRIRTAAIAAGMIYVQWVEQPDLTITVADADGGVEERGAGGAGEGERPYRAEFGPFPPGVYLVDSPDLPVSAEVQLAADEAAVVTLMGGGFGGF